MWSVYIVECADRSYYCGITTNITRRLKEHNSGRGAKYTRGRGPITLKAIIHVDTKSKALKLEAKIKKQKKKDKLAYLLSH
ncbi:MAG: GIY-YIG nuclease family protein [Rhodobacteraceae bacterium]|nr:GIY-YIG nuclease family protein [Paracoccaceae bacterium]